MYNDPYFVVCLPKASSMAHATVPRCSHPYASTPMVCPANFLRLHGFWIDLSRGSRPERCKSRTRSRPEYSFTSNSHCSIVTRRIWSDSSSVPPMRQAVIQTATIVGDEIHWSKGSHHSNSNRKLEVAYLSSSRSNSLSWPAAVSICNLLGRYTIDRITCLFPGASPASRLSNLHQETACKTIPLSKIIIHDPLKCLMVSRIRSKGITVKRYNTR